MIRFFLRTCLFDTKYLMFAKSCIDNIGSGFVSSNLHFASFLRQGIYEFLIVKINKDVFTRLCSGKRIITDEMINVMNNSFNHVNIVTNIFKQRQNQEQNNYVGVQNNARDLETEIANDVIIHESQSPLMET